MKCQFIGVTQKNETYFAMENKTFFYFSSTTALVQKLGKELEDANFVVKQVETIEQASGQKRTLSAGDSTGCLSKGSSR